MSTRAVQITELLTGLTHPTTGAILDNHTAFFYAAGTSTPKNVWTEKEQTNAYVEVDLGAIGQTQLYAEGDYKIVIEVAASGDDGDIIYTWDNLRFEHPNYYVRAITSNHTQVSNDDFLLCNTTSGQITISGLAAASWKHPLKIMRTSGANNIVFDPNGSEQIDGSSTLTISSDAIVEIVSNGSTLYSAGIRSSFVDSDGDTQIQVEESADEDKIRFDVGGTEVGLLSGTATESYFKINSIEDADGDTKIQVEESADEDTIRFDVAGSQIATIDADGITADEVDAVELKVGGTKINATPVEINAICDQSALDLKWESSVSSQPIMYLKNTNADANAACMRFVKDSASPADDDYLGLIQAQGDDDAAVANIFTEIKFFSSDVSDGDEAGAIKLSALVDGTKRNLLELKGYNGSVNQGEIILNEDGQDVDFRVEASGAANAFKVQGSDGAVSISETLDIGSSTTRRVAPTGTFVNNSNGNPDINDTILHVDTDVTESTWESVGPTDSGADNIWTALDDVPTDADWIEVMASTSGEDGAASTDLYLFAYVLDNATEPGSWGVDNIIGAAKDFSDSSGNAFASSLVNRKIPVTNAIFKVRWTGTFTTENIDFALTGWGFNP